MTSGDDRGDDDDAPHRWHRVGEGERDERDDGRRLGRWRSGPFGFHPLRFPDKFPPEVGEYRLDISDKIDRDDEIATVTIACAPFGPGEIVINSLAVGHRALFVTLSGGQPRRRYTYEILVKTESGLTVPFVVHQDVPPVLHTDRAPPITSHGLGTAITWPTLIGWAGFPILGRPRPPSKHPFTINLALIGGL